MFFICFFQFCLFMPVMFSINCLTIILLENNTYFFNYRYKTKTKGEFSAAHTVVSTKECKKNVLQLGKGGGRRARLRRARQATLSQRGAAAHHPPRFFFFLFEQLMYFAKVALFPSTPRKLSLPPLDWARRCDSESPSESSVAQI